MVFLPEFKRYAGTVWKHSPYDFREMAADYTYRQNQGVKTNEIREN
jgi:hypothetical protein